MRQSIPFRTLAGKKDIEMDNARDLHRGLDIRDLTHHVQETLDTLPM